MTKSHERDRTVDAVGAHADPAGEAAPQVEAEPYTILVVDDDPDILDLVTFKLETAGHRVMTATTGPEALAIARERRPDGMVLDVGLPGLSGLDVCFRLRTEFATSRLPVLMLTARSQPSDITSGLAVGAKDYMVKPFNTRELVRRVEALLPRIIH